MSWIASRAPLSGCRGSTVTQALRAPGYHRQWQQSRMQLTSYCSNWTRNTGKTAKDSILLIRTRCRWCPGLHRRLVDWFVFLPVFLPQKIFVRLPPAPLQWLCRSRTRLLLPEFYRLVFVSCRDASFTWPFAGIEPATLSLTVPVLFPVVRALQGGFVLHPAALGCHR